MKKLFALFAITCLICSCFRQKPISSSTARNNDDYKISYLFEHEGCKVFRFEDRGNLVYYTNCNNAVTSISSDSIKIESRSDGRIRRRE